MRTNLKSNFPVLISGAVAATGWMGEPWRMDVISFATRRRVLSWSSMTMSPLTLTTSHCLGLARGGAKNIGVPPVSSEIENAYRLVLNASVCKTTPVRSKGMGAVISSMLTLYASATDVRASPADWMAANRATKSVASGFIRGRNGQSIPKRCCTGTMKSK